MDGFKVMWVLKNHFGISSEPFDSKDDVPRCNDMGWPAPVLVYEHDGLIFLMSDNILNPMYIVTSRNENDHDRA